jgi:type IV pilus assembly protein PilA
MWLARALLFLLPTALAANAFHLKFRSQLTMKATQKGFTLIELMIVVAIIGILAAIAIPAYQTYTIRAQVSEGASLASGLETAFAENYANTGMAAGAGGNADVGILKAITGTYVSSVALTNPGQITVTYGAGANAKILNATMTYTAYMSPNGDIAWVCNDGTATLKAIANGTLTVVNGGTAAAAVGVPFSNTPSYMPTVCQ